MCTVLASFPKLNQQVNPPRNWTNWYPKWRQKYLEALEIHFPTISKPSFLVSIRQISEGVLFDCRISTSPRHWGTCCTIKKAPGRWALRISPWTWLLKSWVVWVRVIAIWLSFTHLRKPGTYLSFGCWFIFCDRLCFGIGKLQSLQPNTVDIWRKTPMKNWIFWIDSHHGSQMRSYSDDV